MPHPAAGLIGHLPNGIIGLALFACGAALAQTPAPQIDPPSELTSSHAKTMASVDVTGHYDNGVGSSDASSQGIILGRLLQDIPLLRPGQVLEAIPGMVVTQHSGDGKANQYFLRGYNLDHGTDFATQLDGVPVNMPTNAHGQGYSDLNFLIPELVQQIDYRKGTYFAQNGDFSAAGSADISYREVIEHPFVQLTLGSDDYRRVLLAGSFPLLPSTAHAPTVLAAIEGLGENGPWKHPERMRKINGLLRLSNGDAARGWSLDALAYDAHWNATDQVPLAWLKSAQLCRFCAVDPTDGGNSARDILSAEWHASDADGYTRISAYLEHYRLQLFSNFTFYELRPDTGDQFAQKEARNLLGVKLAHAWTHNLFGRDSSTEAGLQVRHDHIRVGLFNTADRVPFETVSDSRVGETEAAVYVENSTTWNPWFRTVLGVRQDTIQMHLSSLSLATNSGNASASRTSPKLALIFGPWAKTEFFINAGTGFHSNDARGAIYRIDPTTATQAMPAPPFAGARGGELGVRTELVPGLQSSLTGWRLDSASELVYNADSAIGTTSPNGASTRYGIEWNNHLTLNQWLLLDADLAYTHARFTHPNENDQRGSYIPNAVPKVASIGFSTQGLKDWSGTIKLRYIGRYPLSQDGSLMGPSATVIDLRVSRDINPSLALSLDVLNLFDRSYYDIAYEQDYRATPTSPTVPSGITVHPGEPREFRLTLKMKL
ncbi:TonB-dependent receptor [Dyella silvatica]|uniref:TonB-dependent receptor n=1 Tax=Dyella silvatica TaxID=2992128 RepID=UPI0022522DE3|nr:TonB-dependent receptor [Dyella silvatica]